MKQITFILFLVLLVRTLPAQVILNDPKATHQLVYANQEQISAYIQQTIESLIAGNSVKIEGDEIFVHQVLSEFYSYRDFMPAWSNYASLIDALQGLENASDDGLNPADYHTGSIRQVLKKIGEEQNGSEVDLRLVAEFDVLVTDAVLLYAYHLLVGKVDPETLDPNWNYNFHQVLEDGPYRLEKAIENARVSRELQKLRPRNKSYGESMELLKFYRNIEKSGGWKQIPPGKVIHTGEQDERSQLIRERLAVTEELNVARQTSGVTYDSLLVEDVKHFQHRNGLTPDGIIGPGTLEMLNIPVEDRINTIRVNLERNRWIASNLSDDYIIVNVAAFKAYYIEDQKLRFTTNVQVGTTYTQTPIFKDRLRYIEFNPTWTVPSSIVGKSIIPHMKQDPNYLESRNFELIDRSGKIISQSQVNVEGLSLRNFPYTVRQKPGPDNALGIVKFIFPNKHAVYMHDTPSKSLFEMEDRAFSHGCIRTQNPLDLAEILLEGTEWNRDKINAVLQTQVTTRAYPEKDIDVLLMYWTAGFYDGEGIGFFRDVYNRDAKVLKQLDSKELAPFREAEDR